MAEREQIKRNAPRPSEEVGETAPAASEAGEKLKSDLDDLLEDLTQALG